MARTPAASPQMNISITTAIKAGFFGAIGFFIAQLVIVPLTLLLLLICGVSLAGLGLAASKVNPPQRFTNGPAPAGYSINSHVDR